MHYLPSLLNIMFLCLVEVPISAKITLVNIFKVWTFSGLFESPLFLYIGCIDPSSQESGNTPELKIKLKKATYNGIISCAVALIYSFIIPSFEHALLFFKLLTNFKILFSEI